MLHGATARRPRPDSAASRDCGSKSLLAGVVGAAHGRKRRADCSVSINAAAFSVVISTVRASDSGWCIAPAAGPLQIAKYGHARR